MHISEQEIWLRAYCAALTGAACQPHVTDDMARSARLCGNQALKDFQTRFPKFRFASNEGKADE